MKTSKLLLALLLAALSGVASAALVAEWKLNDAIGSGMAVNSASGMHAGLTGAGASTSDFTGTSYRFDGAIPGVGGKYFFIDRGWMGGTNPPEADFYTNNAFAWSMDIKTTSTSGGGLLGLGDAWGTGTKDFGFWDADGGRIGMWLEGTGTPGGTQYIGSTTIVNDGQWHNVGVAYTGTTLMILVDGVVEASRTIDLSATPAYASDTPYFSIGYHGGLGWYKGEMKNIQINSIPEPATMSLLLVGAILAANRKRQTR